MDSAELVRFFGTGRYERPLLWASHSSNFDDRFQVVKKEGLKASPNTSARTPPFFLILLFLISCFGLLLEGGVLAKENQPNLVFESISARGRFVVVVGCC